MGTLSIDQIRVGGWYAASYGFDTVVGPCVGFDRGGAVLMFRWGTLWRGARYVSFHRIHAEVTPPRLVRLFRWIAARLSSQSNSGER